MNIYFCGMIGSGKTTIGKRLAQTLGRDFYDLDQEMNRMLGYSFHKLVRAEGWLAFRELEYSICKRFARLDNSVICLGGGTVRYEWNMDVLKGSGPLILLTASLEELIRRVKAADRPRVNIGTTLEEDIRMIWEKSRDKYFGAADIVYATDQKSIDEEVRDLRHLISRYITE
ncbi:MAG: shikimate kinase [Desulfobacterales bacterium]|nr:MAG: shikimate kinase [Desulfobacterales bacterium]